MTLPLSNPAAGIDSCATAASSEGGVSAGLENYYWMRPISDPRFCESIE
jgi:hypothetical protein